MAGRAEKKGKATKTGKERKRKSQPSGLTRRQVLKMGAVAGGVAILTSTKSFRTHFPDSVLAQGVASCGQSTGHSPEHCPFAQQMPIPPALDTTILNPVPQKAANIGAGEAARCDHQRWTDFPFKRQYAMSSLASVETISQVVLWGSPIKPLKVRRRENAIEQAKIDKLLKAGAPLPTWISSLGEEE
jgi:hypothetical protein